MIGPSIGHRGRPNLFPYYPERVRIVRKGLAGTRIYSVDGVYFVDNRNAAPGVKFIRIQCASYYDAALLFVRIQEKAKEAARKRNGTVRIVDEEDTP